MFFSSRLILRLCPYPTLKTAERIKNIFFLTFLKYALFVFFPSALFSVMCYNVLCDKYATRQLYGYCPSWALNWEYRKKNIMQEILGCNADIISLQVRNGRQSMCLGCHRNEHLFCMSMQIQETKNVWVGWL